MKMTIDAGMMLDTFRNWDRNYYTYEACEALLDWYDEIDPDTEFDPVAICCEWNEYGETPCLQWKDFIRDYKYLIDEDEAADMDEDELKEAIIDELEEKTFIIKLSDSVLVLEF